MTTNLPPVQVAIEAARSSALILRRGYGKQHQITHKGLVDLVTERDRESEANIMRIIRSHFPGHQIWGEESGRSGAPGANRWIVDPLDGTTNYAHGYPAFCISIAYEQDGHLEAGVVLDVLRRELFVAQRGQGATLNGKPMHVSPTSALIESLLATGFPYDRDRLKTALDQFERMAYATQGLRRDGAAALNLAYVAAGRFDGFWEGTLSPWDCAAGVLLVQEAGGIVTDLVGTPYETSFTAVASSNGLIHQPMIEVIAAARTVPSVPQTTPDPCNTPISTAE